MLKNKLTPLEIKWILYDVGNSAFILLVATILPIYFNYICTLNGLSENQYLSFWGYAASLSTIIVAFAGPIIGTMSDFKNKKKPLFLTLSFLGIIGLFCLGFPKTWLGFLILFVLIKVFYSLSLVIYDAMLTDITKPQNLDMVSSYGYAWGYIGSVIPFAFSLVFALFYEQMNIDFSLAMIICFAINAAWWLAFTVPLGKSYKQIHSLPQDKHYIKNTFSRLGKTFQELRKNKKCFLFLLAFFFYIDGVYTIVEMATAYGTSLGLSQNGLLTALLVTQIVAFPAAIVCGMLAKKYSASLLIKICIAAYFGIAVFALFLTNLTQFWILAICVGLFQGGIQALSRSYFAKIIPVDASGEYFGLFDICGKGATFLGTFIVGAITQITGTQNLAVGCLAFLFIIGFILFSKSAALPDEATPSTK